MTDVVNIGTNPNDGSGDKLRTAFGKINAAFLRGSQPKFGASLNPQLHLKQFSTRPTSLGAGAVPGTVTFSGGGVASIGAGAGGQNYVNPRVLITGDGTGAAATATVAGGVVTGYVITAPGINYTQATIYVVDGPVVVLTGDSISTEQPTPSIPAESEWYTLWEELTEQNPDKTITFFNRAIGGETWTNFNGVANGGWPAWYVDTPAGRAKDWLAYIEELQPDLVVIALGMNDRQNFVPAQMRAAMTEITTWTDPPDVILCTPLVPSAISADETISSVDSQEGRDWVAGYLRGYALRNGMGLLDFNRQCRLVRDGQDVRSSALKTMFTAQSKSLPYVASDSGRDCVMESTFSGLSAGWWTGRKINTLIARKQVNVELYVRVEDSAGVLKTTVYELNVGPQSETIQTSLVSLMATPTTGSLVLRVTVVDQRLQVLANDTPIFDQIIYRGGANYLSELAVVPADVASVSMSLYVGDPVTYNPRLTDDDIYGTSGGAYKGNTLNHPSSIGIAYIFEPVIQAVEWHANPICVGDAVTTSGNIGIGIADPLGKFHLRKKKPLVPVTPYAGANIYVLEDADAAGMSMLTDNTGIARIVAGDSDNTSQWVQAYDHTNDLYQEIMGGTVLRTVSANADVAQLPRRLKSYAKAALPNAGTAGAGAEIYVTDDVGGATPAFSDGVNWRRVADRAVIS